MSTYLDVQSVGIRNLYPAYPGGTLGQASSGASPYPQVQSPTMKNSGGAAERDSSVNPDIARAIDVGAQHPPMPYWIALVALVIGLGFVTKKYGEADATFGNVKASAYNILMISLIAVVGISFLKVLTTRVKIPGLTTLVGMV